MQDLYMGGLMQLMKDDDGSLIYGYDDGGSKNVDDLVHYLEYYQEEAKRNPEKYEKLELYYSELNSIVYYDDVEKFYYKCKENNEDPKKVLKDFILGYINK